MNPGRPPLGLARLPVPRDLRVCDSCGALLLRRRSCWRCWRRLWLGDCSGGDVDVGRGRRDIDTGGERGFFLLLLLLLLVVAGRAELALVEGEGFLPAFGDGSAGGAGGAAGWRHLLGFWVSGSWGGGACLMLGGVFYLTRRI